MKDFVKMTLATIAGLFIFGFLALFMMIGLAGSVAALGEGQPVMPRQGILTIDMSKIVLSEQTVEADPFVALQSGGTAPKPLGIWDAVNAINAAAIDPAIKFIYLKPDGLSGHYAQVEEFRSALSAFRLRSGKPLVAYMQNPGNGNYYLASVADKIYMPP